MPGDDFANLALQEVILGVFLKGAGLAQLLPQALALAAISAALFGAALLKFRR